MNPVFVVLIYVSFISSVHYITSLHWSEYRNFMSMIIIMIIVAATWSCYDQDRKFNAKIESIVDQRLHNILEEKEHLEVMKSLPLAMPGDEVWDKRK